jgi:hypothetical protein
VTVDRKILTSRDEESRWVDPSIVGKDTIPKVKISRVQSKSKLEKTKNRGNYSQEELIERTSEPININGSPLLS